GWARGYFPHIGSSRPLATAGLGRMDMHRTAQSIGVVALLVIFGSTISVGQCPTTVVGFNGPPINDPATAFEMFRIPQTSPTTAGFIVANTSGNNNNSTYRASGFQTEGDAGLETFFDWLNPADPASWLRLTTSGGAVG